MLTHAAAGAEVDGTSTLAGRSGGIVGAMSLLRDDVASATVTVRRETPLFEIDVASSGRLLASQDELLVQLLPALGSEIASKIVALRGGTAAQSG